jgi:glycosyltransferase involved in cell wall biosynthesis
MKILQALSQRPEATGSGITLQAFIGQSKKRGHELRLLAGIPKGPKPLIDHLASDEAHFLEFEGQDFSYPVLGMSDVMPYPSRRFSTLSLAEIKDYQSRFASKVRSIVEEFQPDIIHSHHLWLMTAAIKKEFPHIPLVVSCHGTGLRQFKNLPALQDLLLETLPKVDAVLALGQAQKKDILQCFGFSKEKVHVVGAGVNQALFKKGQKREGVVQIVYAGKLSRSKGVIFLLRALESIKDKNWRLHLLGGGSGSEKEEVLNKAKDFGDQIKIYGAVSQKECAALMGSSDLFVLPSLYEGLPLVLLEALSSGCRLISTSLTGVKEIFEGFQSRDISFVPVPKLKNIDEVAEEAEEGFANALTEVLKVQIDNIEKNKTWDSKNIKALLKQYSWSAVFDKIEAIYQKL